MVFNKIQKGYKAKSNNIGKWNASASPHGGKNNPNLVEARGRKVHIKGHRLEFGS